MSPFASCAALLLMVASGVSALDHRALDGLTIAIYTRSPLDKEFAAICSTNDHPNLSLVYRADLVLEWPDMMDHPLCLWKVTAEQNGVRLENVKFPHYYIADTTILTLETNPARTAKTLWKMNTFSYGYSMRNDFSAKYILALHNGALSVQANNIGVWRILTPNYSDDYKLVARLENNGNAPETLSMKVTTGMSTTSTNSQTLSEEATLQYKREVTRRLLRSVLKPGTSTVTHSFGMKINHKGSWTSTSSKSFNAEKEVEMSITVQPGKVKEVYQLVGNFEGFTVGTDSITVQESNADGDVGACAAGVDISSC